MIVSVNFKQGLALAWTIIAIAISLIVVLPTGLVQTLFPGTPTADYMQFWYLIVFLFFGIFLVVTLPVYLLIAVWGLAADDVEVIEVEDKLETKEADKPEGLRKTPS